MPFRKEQVGRLWRDSGLNFLAVWIDGYNGSLPFEQPPERKNCARHTLAVFCTTRRLPVLRSVRIPVVFDDFPSGGEAPGDLWSEKSFANVSEVAGNSRIKM